MSGRNLPADIVVIAALNVLATIVLFVSLWSALVEIPTLISGLFNADGFSFALSYIFLVVLVVFAFICLTPLAVAYFLLRADPVGRELQAFMLALLILTAFGLGQIPGTYWFALVATGVCVAVLYLSPWAQQALRESARARQTPGPVVLARCLSFALFVTLALGVVLSLPGLRFLTTLGPSFIFAVLADAAGAAFGWSGYKELTSGPSTTGRRRISLGCAFAVAGQLIITLANSQPFSSTLPRLLIASTIVGALWLPQHVKDWFAAGGASPFVPTQRMPAPQPPTEL
ncbi:MAG: hypothetical protein ACXVYW_14930 [Oryzihumus sp.]